MSDPQEKKPKQSQTVQICAMVFLVAGIVGFQAVAPNLFPALPEGGFNWQRFTRLMDWTPTLET